MPPLQQLSLSSVPRPPRSILRRTSMSYFVIRHRGQSAEDSWKLRFIALGTL